LDTLTRRGFLKVGGTALVVGGSLPLLVSCGNGTSSSAATLGLSNDKVTWKDWFQSEGNAAKQATGAAWKPSEYADTNTYQAAIRTSGASSKAPDLFTWWSGWLMKDIVDAGFAQDVSSYWDKEGSAYSNDLRSLFTFNGKTYGAPLYFGPWVTFYNKKVFDKYGLQAPKTWSDLQHVMQTLKSNGVTPYGATVDGRWPAFIYFETLLVNSDPALYKNLMAGKAKYTDPGVVEAMNLWGQLIKAGYFTDPSSVTFGTGSNSFVNSFVQGKAAMVEIGSWYEPTLTAANLTAGQDFGAFLFPNIKEGIQNAVIIESGPHVAAAHGSHKDDAGKALGWFMSKAGQEAWIKATGFTSARSDVSSPSPVDQQLLQDMKSGSYQQVNRYWEATPHDIVETAIDEFAKFMLQPGDPMPILTAVQRKADSVWASVK
jgi:multiple sugar transport system substrate-binding protein